MVSSNVRHQVSRTSGLARISVVTHGGGGGEALTLCFMDRMPHNDSDALHQTLLLTPAAPTVLWTWHLAQKHLTLNFFATRFGWRQLLVRSIRDSRNRLVKCTTSIISKREQDFIEMLISVKTWCAAIDERCHEASCGIKKSLCAMHPYHRLCHTKVLHHISVLIPCCSCSTMFFLSSNMLSWFGHLRGYANFQLCSKRSKGLCLLEAS